MKLKKYIRHIINSLLLSSFLFYNVTGQVKDTVSVKKQVLHNPLEELREQLDDTFNDPNVSNAFWGVLIKSLKTGEVIYKRNSDKLFNPASNIKLFTSTAALFLLGPNYVYQTGLYANGEIKNNRLEGDLIIQGSGDPTISNRFFSGSITGVFESWADSLISLGIREVTGDILGDDALFDNHGLGRGWSWDNESAWFAAPSGALSFNDNTITVVIKPSETGFPANIEVIPNTGYASLIKKVITSNNNSVNTISVSKLRGTNVISVSGSIAKDSKPVIEHISISDPTMFFLTVFKEVCEQKGISVRGKSGSITTSPKIILSENLSPLILHESVPMHMIIKELNKNSNNFYAEQILKTIGYEAYNFGTTENGVKACKELFYSMGVNPENMVMVDGSGLSRLNLVSPRQIINLLTYIYSSGEFEPFYDSLPIGGVDGTIAERMKRTSAENNVRAKAGFNENISSLSGYLKTTGGETFAFSIIVNNFLVSPSLINYIMDNVCNRLVNFTRN